MSLYHKYRPDSLSQVKGNADIVTALEGMLKTPETCSHAFLLHGPTGCGKTTIGRIIARILQITERDMQEIDSADFRGIDTIREIRKNCNYKPMESPFRMYLMDEVHQLSKDAQSALLKILEDTPRHVFFVLCTTDPVKLLPTVRNRCQQLQVKQLDSLQMKGLIKKVVKGEGDSIESDVMEQIILDANGHPRNALQILEQVLNTVPEGRLDAAKQTAKETSESIELCRAMIANSNWKQVSKILEGLKQQEPESIRRHVLGYAQSVLLKADNTKAALVIEEFLEPTYNSGFPQIVYAAYSVVKNS